VADTEILNIAIVCHEANRAYCRTLGDHSQPAWGVTPDWQQKSAIKGVQFHLAALAEGEKPSPSVAHDAWLADKKDKGWKHGPVKDADKREHPDFMPYEKLSPQAQRKDFLFAAVVAAFFEHYV
jgi:hypothetical protein